MQYMIHFNAQAMHFNSRLTSQTLYLYISWARLFCNWRVVLFIYLLHKYVFPRSVIKTFNQSAFDCEKAQRRSH